MSSLPGAAGEIAGDSSMSERNKKGEERNKGEQKGRGHWLGVGRLIEGLKGNGEEGGVLMGIKNHRGQASEIITLSLMRPSTFFFFFLGYPPFF